jgi:putative DNA primase/helicase
VPAPPDGFETSFATTAPINAPEDAIIVPAPGNPIGVARIFIDDRYSDTRAPLLVHHRGLFYSWRGTHWPEGEGRAVRSELYRWLDRAQYWKETKAGPELAPFEPTKTKVANVLEALEALVHIAERTEAPAWVNGKAPWPAEDTVAMANGLLRLSTRKLHPHTPQFFNEHVLPFGFDPRAPKPKRWHRFLRELWDDDQESIDALGEIMGYIVAGGSAQQKIFMLVGPKRTGKGTILRVLTALLGPENVAAPTLSSLAMNFGLQPLVGKPLAAISDARLGSRSDALVAVERLLSISGEDAITVDRKYRDPWTGRLPTRFVLLTNEIPRFTDASGALASRFVILTLTHSFYGREDPTLTDQLVAEAPGIFNWCLEGLDRLVARGHFVQPKAAASALRHLEDLASPVNAFVRDRCRVGAGLWVAKDALWSSWKQWCSDEGAHHGTRSLFVRDLRAAVPGATPQRPRKPDGTREHVITGLTLEVETTMEKTPDHPDQRDQKDAENGFGQGGQGSSALLFQLGDDGYLDVLERAYATGHITEQERREARLVHLAVFRARAA